MLKIRNLFVKYYNTGVVAINNISFDVQKGEIVGILGPSGCGKTTLLNVISKLLTEKDAEIRGEILIDESNKKDLNINIVFQKPTLLPWRTVLKNMGYGLEIKNIAKDKILKESENLLEIIGLKGFENYYPHQISQGMQQRINLARALACKPDLILFDEPFSALDFKTKKILLQDFLKILSNNGITGILVTHNIEEVMCLAGKIVFLSERPSSVKKVLDQKDFRFKDNERNLTILDNRFYNY